MSSVRKLASQTAIYGINSIVGRLVVLGLTPLYSHTIPDTEYGIFSDLYVYITYFLVILTFGMETSFFRFSSKLEDDRLPYSQSFIFVTVLASLFLAFQIVFNQQISAALSYSGREGLVYMVGWITFLDVMIALPMARLRYDERPITFSVITLTSIIITLLLNIYFFAYTGETTAEYIFLSNLIASAAKFILLVVLSLPIAKIIGDRIQALRNWKPINLLPSQFRVDKGVMKGMVGFGVFIMLAGLSGMINQNSDVNFLKRVWGDNPQMFQGVLRTGDSLAGLYAISKKLAVPILLVTQAFRYAAEPFFFKQAKQEDSREVFARVFHYFIIGSLLVTILVGSFVYEIVTTQFLGIRLIHQNYWAALDVVPLLLLTFTLWGAYINLSIWFKITGQVRFGLLISLSGSLVIIIMNVLLIPYWGFYGSAFAMLCCFSLMCTMVYSLGKKYYPIPYRLKRLAIYGIIALVGLGINVLLGPSEIFSALFFNKFLITLIAILLVYMMERSFPMWGKTIPAALESKE